MPNTITLDIEQARADAFDVLSELDRKHGIFEVSPSDLDLDDDEELYAFIDEYNSIIEKQGRELSNALRFLYELKATAISRIDKKYNGRSLVLLDGNAFTLNFRNSKDKRQIMSVYHQDFCNEALNRISKFTDATSALLDMEILDLLNRRESEPNLKPSIQQFINHERDLNKRQSRLIDDFYKKIKQKLGAAGDDRIKIIDLTAFSFLKTPFPEV